MFDEELAHRPAVDGRESGRLTKGDPFAFVQRDCGGDSFVFVALEVGANELPERVALAAEDPCVDGPVDQKVLVSGIGAGDTWHDGG